jgi:hypothetical protein
MDESLGPDECYLFDTPEGRKYVCTTNPEELAWHMGLDMRELVSGHKPEDLNLVECSEEWSHNGTPQWVCKEDTPPPSASADADEEGCELIGETDDELWFTCSEGGASPGVDCSEDTTFGVGGGPGILPQDGEVLCKQSKPKKVAVSERGPRLGL